MKTYNKSEAEETLFGILSIQDKQALARELAKIMVSKEKGWSINSMEISIRPTQNNDPPLYTIKIGEEK